MESRVVGFILILVILLGFSIDKDRGDNMGKRDVIVPLVKAIDNLQYLGFNNTMSFEDTIEIRLEIKAIIERINKDK